MWVSKILLSNIRGFSNSEIEFSKKINVLIGPNNCGKTTILNSVFSLQASPLNKLDTRIGSKRNAFVDIWLQNAEKAGQWKIPGIGNSWSNHS